MIKNIEDLKTEAKNSFFLIAGPCAIESEEISFKIAERIVSITNKLNIPLIFKGSYKKANRSRLDSFTGIGDDVALNIIKNIGNRFKIATTTDIHKPDDAKIAANYVDILQIPAFLCRQTDLLISAAQTGKIVNIKKGQFLSSESMSHVVKKITDSGNNNILLTERGTMLGYQDLVVDFRSIPTMQKNNFPVVLDVTHSLQKPNQKDGITGGNPDMIETIAKAGIAVGADGIFLETHPNPSEAKSDGENMLPIDRLEDLLIKLVKIRKSLN